MNFAVLKAKHDDGVVHPTKLCVLERFMEDASFYINGLTTIRSSTGEEKKYEVINPMVR